VKRRSFLAAGAAAALAACSSSRKVPRLPALAAERGRIRWSVDLDGGGYGFTPAVVGDSVYAAGSRGSIARMSLASGAQEWRVDTKARLVTGVGATSGLVAVTDEDGVLRVYDDAGSNRWQAYLGAEAVSVPALDGDVLVVRGSDNRVLAFDAYTGRRRWVYTRQNPPLVLRQTNRPRLDGATAYVGLPGGRLVSLSTQTGALRWESAISLPRGSNEIERIADVLGEPVLVGRQLCAGSYQGRVGCVDAASGRPLWNRDISAVGAIDFDGRRLVAVDTRGRVHAINDAGEPVWTQEALAGRLLGAPALLGDAVALGDEEGYLHWLAVEDGRLLGRVRIDGSAIVSAPSRAGSLAIVQTARGRVAAAGLD
jgi:outer membrane protein assembly factor BamB